VLFFLLLLMVCYELFVGSGGEGREGKGGKGREGKGRQGKGRQGEGRRRREEKGHPEKRKKKKAEVGIQQSFNHSNISQYSTL